MAIEIDGEKVAAIGPDAGALADGGDALPRPPPAALPARAKKLGTLSAGAAQFGTGAALAAMGQPSEPPPGSAPPRRTRAGKRRARAH